MKAQRWVEVPTLRMELEVVIPTTLSAKKSRKSTAQKKAEASMCRYSEMRAGVKCWPCEKATLAI